MLTPALDKRITPAILSMCNDVGSVLLLKRKRAAGLLAFVGFLSKALLNTQHQQLIPHRILALISVTSS
jgi:hypothetical protein